MRIETGLELSDVSLHSYNSHAYAVPLFSGPVGVQARELYCQPPMACCWQNLKRGQIKRAKPHVARNQRIAAL